MIEYTLEYNDVYAGDVADFISKRMKAQVLPRIGDTIELDINGFSDTVTVKKVVHLQNGKILVGAKQT